ncbi:hypothetical protein MNB_SV-14-676 [hydrothermal vent metagenome]|uniref:Lipoprotein n=1 Tax=hydrothermal vent metagenome TaxID=652676 RepID=A0A1W1CBD1_9ZZZZ
MKLKQADKSTINYPSRYNFKPMLLGVGVAVALSGCLTNQPNINKTTNNKVLIKKQTENKKPKQEHNEKNKFKNEVEEPEVLGGVPLPPPDMKPKKAK